MLDDKGQGLALKLILKGIFWNMGIALVFSSPELKAQVSYCHSASSVVCPSVVVVRPSVNFSHFQLLLQNRLMDFDETW